MSNTQIIGKFGEILAKKYLMNKGYRIIDTNIKLGYYELDIITYYQGIYIFFEIKTRTNLSLGSAEDAINRHKIKFLKTAVLKYFKLRNIATNNFRIDFLAIDINKANKKANIKHFKDII